MTNGHHQMNGVDLAAVAQLARSLQFAAVEVGAAGCRSAERRLTVIEIDAAHHLWFFTWAPVRHLAEELSDREVTLTFGDELRGMAIEGRIWGHRDVQARLARWGLDPQTTEHRAELVPLVLEVVPVRAHCWGERSTPEPCEAPRIRTPRADHPVDPFNDRAVDELGEDAGRARLRWPLQ
jgi:hypothetical protein